MDEPRDGSTPPLWPWAVFGILLAAAVVLFFVYVPR